MNLTRNGLIVLISVIFVAGAGTAYAGILPLITLAGNVQVDGDLNVDGEITGDASIIPFKLAPISSGSSIRTGTAATCPTAPVTPCLIIIPHSGKVVDLTVRGFTDAGIAQGPGVGNTYTMKINKNGGLTPLSCIMSGTSSICKSTTSIEVNQFDRIHLNILASVGANTGNIVASVLLIT